MAITAGDTAAITAGDVQAITAGDTAAITAGDVQAITAGDTAAITAGDVQAITAGDTAAITAGDVQAITAGDTAAITAGDVQAITAGDTAAITAGDVQAITAGDTAAITAGDVQAITAGDTTAITAGDVQAITAADQSLSAAVNQLGPGFGDIPRVVALGVSMDAAATHITHGGEMLELIAVAPWYPSGALSDQVKVLGQTLQLSSRRGLDYSQGSTVAVFARSADPELRPWAIMPISKPLENDMVVLRGTVRASRGAVLDVSGFEVDVSALMHRPTTFGVGNYVQFTGYGGDYGVLASE